MTDEGEPADEVHDFDPAANRLRFRTRWAAAAIALTPFLPYELIDGHPQFLWQLAGELSPAGLVAALAACGAGIVALLAGVLTKRASTLAIAIVGALVGAALVVKLGADQSAWEVLPLPESLSARPGWPLLALALTAAGANLSFPEHSRRVGRAFLISAFALTAVYYGWPTRGEAPIATVGRALGALDVLPDWRFKLGFIVMAVMALWPGIVALLGLLLVRKPPADDHPIIGIVALYGLPLLMAMFIYRGVPGSVQYGWNLFTAAGAVAVLAAVVALLAAALEVLGRTYAPPPDAEIPGGWSPKKASLVTGGLVLLLGVTQWVLARPPAKGVEWTPKDATAAGDAFYGKTLPAWNRARLRWDREARHHSGASAMIEVRGAARELVEGATALDAGLGAAVKTLTRESRDLHVAGRRWCRLVADVNDAARRAGLPYYLDPTLYTFQTDAGIRRHFDARTYAVESVHRYVVSGRDYATLHVRSIGGRGLPLLGFSRDLQPFAMVALDEIAEFEDSLLKGAVASPPTCDETPSNPLAGPVLERCGESLAALVAKTGGDLHPAIVALTDRHELQHQIDGPHLVMSGAVKRHLPRRGEKFQKRVNRELSAYVAELVASDVPPKLGLLHLLRFAVSGHKGSAEHNVALVALEAMGGDRVSDAHGDVDMVRLVGVYDVLAKLDDDTLRARAREAWADLYGYELAEVMRPPD